MKNFFKAIGTFLVIAVMVALLVWGIRAYIEYDMNLYKRKYPNTTEFDYWMDHGKR